MTKNTKTILGVVAVAGVGYYLYNQHMKNKGTKNFVNYVDEDFYNVGGGKISGTKQTTLQSGMDIGSTGCEIVQGNAGYVGMPLSNNRIIVRTGNGTTLICPRGQQFNLPTSF